MNFADAEELTHMTVTYKVCRQIDKVSIVFVDEFNHGTLQDLKIHMKIIPQHFQLNFTSTLDDKVFHMEVILQTSTMSHTQ